MGLVGMWQLLCMGWGFDGHPRPSRGQGDGGGEAPHTHGFASTATQPLRWPGLTGVRRFVERVVGAVGFVGHPFSETPNPCEAFVGQGRPSSLLGQGPQRP